MSLKNIYKAGSEAEVHFMVAQWLKLQYPDVIFRTDYGAGLKMTMRQAVNQKKLQSGDKYPDLFIASPTWQEVDGLRVITSCGLYLELKKGGTKLKKKNGEWATPHIAEQAQLMERLERLGYVAEFACGFDEAVERIKAYFNGER